MSGGQTALTYGLAPGLHVFGVCVLGFPLRALSGANTHVIHTGKVLMTQTALTLSFTPYLSIFTFLCIFP